MFKRYFYKYQTLIINLTGLFFFNFLTAAISFITNIKIANKLDTEAFGNLSFAIAIGMFAAAFVRFGFDRTLVKHLVQIPANYDNLVISSLFIRVILCILFCISISASCYLGFINLSIGAVFVILSLSFISLDLQPVFDSKMMMIRHSLYNFIQKFFYFISIWFCLLLFPSYFNIQYIGVSMLFGAVIFLVMQFIWAKNNVIFKLPPLHIVINLIKSDYPVWIAVIANLSFGYLTQIILKIYCGSAELGIYSAAWQIVIVSTLILMQLARLGLPKMSQYCMSEVSTEQRRLFFTKYVLFLLLAVLTISIPCYFLSNSIIGFFYNAQYMSAAAIMKIFAIYIIFFSFGLVSSQYLITNGKNRSYLTIVLLCGGLNIVLNLVLIPHYKGLGAAVAMTISHAVAMMSYFVLTSFHFCFNNKIA